MYRKYRIASSGRAGGVVDRVIHELGQVTPVEHDGWLECSDVLVIDCGNTALPRLEQHWRQALEAGKTLGLIGMNGEDRELLQRITGRAFKGSLKNLFLRRGTNDEAQKYRFTVVPDFDSDMAPARCAHFLRERVFTDSCCSPPTPVAPPETINDLWPVNSQFGKLFASRQTLLSGWRTGGSWPDGSLSYATLNVVGHFFLGNGDGGDNAYHVILLSRLSDVQGLTASSSFQYGFGFMVTPSVQPLDTYSTQPTTTNSPPPPPNWGPLGTYIRTWFGYDPQIQIKTLGTLPGSNEQRTFVIQPSFDEYRNAFTNPGLDSFGVYPFDTATRSSVQFNMFGQLYTDGYAPGVGGWDQAPGKDAFVIVSYFRFPATNAASFPVTFDFQSQVFAMGNGQASGQWHRSVSVDLVKATRLSPVTVAE